VHEPAVPDQQASPGAQRRLADGTAALAIAQAVDQRLGSLHRAERPQPGFPGARLPLEALELRLEDATPHVNGGAGP
jgi:hypothetical protein